MVPRLQLRAEPCAVPAERGLEVTQLLRGVGENRRCRHQLSQPRGPGEREACHRDQAGRKGYVVALAVTIVALVDRLGARGERGERGPARGPTEIERGPAASVQGGSAEGDGRRAKRRVTAKLIDLLIDPLAVPRRAGIHQIEAGT